MASTYTLNNGIELIGTGEQSGTWGDTTNTNFNLVDTALDGQVSIALAAAGNSGSPNNLPVSDGSASNGRNRMITFTDGTDLGATAYVQLTPNDSEKIIYVRNNLRASRSIILFQGTYNASNDYEVPAGTTAVVYFDGAGSGAVAANVFNNAHFDALNVVGNATVGGNVTVTGTVDAGTVEFDNLSGTGTVSVTNILDEDNMASDSATALSTQQSIKAYVDAQVGSFDTLAEVLANGNTTGGTDIVVSVDDVISMDNGTNLLPSLTTTGDLNTGLYFPAADNIGISTGGNQALRIDSAQNVLVGSATAGRSISGVSAGGTIPAFQIESADTVSDGSLALIANYSTSAIGPALMFGRTRSGSVGGTTIVQDGDLLGSVVFSGSDGNDFANYGAAIIAKVDGTPGNNNIPGELILQTTNTGASSVTRLKISKTGEMIFNRGENANSFGAYEFSQLADSVTGGLALRSTDASGGSTLRLYVDSSNVRHIASGTDEVISFTDAYVNLIPSAGVGINTNDPQAPLHIVSGRTSGMLILESDYDGSASTPDLYFYNNSATPADDDLIGNILFRSNTDDGNVANMAQIFVQATDVSAASFNSKMMLKTSVSSILDSRLILTGAGNVTIGTGTMERTNLASTSAALSVEGTTAASAGMSIIRNSDNASAAFLTLGKSRGSSEGSNTILQDGDDIGRIIFAANDGTNFLSSSDIISRVDETTPSSSNVGATLELRTGGGSNVAGTSRIKIRSNGRVYFNHPTMNDHGAYIFKCLGNTTDDGLSVFSSDEGSSMRFLVDTASVRSIFAGEDEVMHFKNGVSQAARVSFPKGDGINVLGPSILRHTDADQYNAGSVAPTLIVQYNSVDRTYNYDASVELAVERASDSVINIVTDASSSSSIWFGDNSAGNSGQINYAHSSNSMVFKTAATTAFNVNSSGNISFPDGQGVLFSAAQTGNGTSSLLHDYEEGTYTPVLSFGGTNANAPAWASGTYTKVGDRVLIDIRMSYSGSLGSSTGTAKITLPFAVANSETSTQWEAIASFFSLSQVTTTLVAAFSDAGGGLIFAETQGSSDQADHSDFPNSSNFRVTGSYRTTA